MELHVRVLAVFHIVFGLIGLIGTLAILIVFGGMAGAAGFAVADAPDAWIAVPVLSITQTLFLFMREQSLGVPRATPPADAPNDEPEPAPQPQAAAAEEPSTS